MSGEAGGTALHGLLGLIGTPTGRGLARHARAVEDQRAVLNRHRVAGKRDHALDQVDVFSRVAEHDHVAAARKALEQPPLERRETQRESCSASSRTAISPPSDNRRCRASAASSPRGC